MMISVYVVLILLLLHFIGDFILQNDKMAIMKSTSNYWLSIHALVYMMPFVLAGIIWISFYPSFILFVAIFGFVVLNFVLHWITDYITSRAASHFYKNDARSLFFKTIGFDQLVHGFTLVLTYNLFFG